MSDRKIPSEEKVAKIIKSVVKSRLRVESQEELARLVLKQLKKENKSYTLSPSRAKRIALGIPIIEVRAKTKRKVGLRKIESCPVCDSKLKPIKVKNLLNQWITVGYKCTKCGYQSDLESFIPMKYLFVLKGI